MADTAPPPTPPPPPPPATAPVKVDRKTTTPFLLKLFYKSGGFHRLDDFRAHTQPHEYVTIYTWRDCTLTELSLLLAAALPTICPPRSRCGFRLIFADTRFGGARYTPKDLGAVVPQDSNADGDGGAVGAGAKTLAEAAFVVGDWIDVAVYPEGHGGVGVTRGAAAGAGGGGGAGFGGGRGGVLGGPRENGFGGFRVRGRGGVGVPQGEWRRGERVEDVVREGAGGGRGYRRGGGGGGGGGRRYRE